MPTLQWVFKQATGRTPEEWSGDGELDWFTSYADPRRDSGKGVLTANWNEFPRKGDHEYNWSAKGQRFQNILERMGYQLEWSDQTSCCDHCYGAITEGPDYHGDSAHYAILGDCDRVCEDCIRKDFAQEYLEGLEDNPRTAVAIRGIDPGEHGYVLLESDFESGFHPGQTANPQQITKRLRAQGVKDAIVFAIDSSGQFDCRFSVWRKKSELELECEETVRIAGELFEEIAQEHRQ